MTNSGNQSEAGRLKIKALTRWEGEGGALGAAQQATNSSAAQSTDALDDMELRILARLGAAVLGEWLKLPADLQGPIFTRASTPYTSAQRVHLKAELARFLNDHKDR
jgi:hypothetical protein